MGEQTTRRTLMGAALAAGAGLTLAGRLRAARAEDEAAPVPAAARKLKLLILGGTGFLGPATVEAALARGHEMTLFNRGRTNTHLFPDLEKLKGDRNGDLDALEGRTWDAVIDTSGYVPRIVDLSAELLKDAVDHYVFISTISVYPGFGMDDYPIDEDTDVGTLEDPTVEKVTGQTYGPLKALCEAAAEQAFPGRTTNIRPGLIVGPRDPTDRFTWWPARVARGGEILAPGDGSTEVQAIDVRDLGAWTIHTIEQQVFGVYNALGYKGHVTFEEFLHGLKCAINTECNFTWAPEAFLAEKKVRAFADMPLWMPSGNLPYVSNDRACEAGLTFRPPGETGRDTADWVAAKDGRGDRPFRVGLRPDREKALLLQVLDAVKFGAK